MDQEKEANPIEEIFDEVFTLMQDLETRSVAVLEYLQEQGGVTDEKLAPYLDRAAAASDVRLRAARARMEHLLAPKPKSSTDVAKGEKTDNGSGSHPQAQGTDAESGKKQPQGEAGRVTKTGPKGVGEELASAQPGAHESAESKNEKSQDSKTAVEVKSDQEDTSDGEQGKEQKAKDAESQAAALSGEKKSEEKQRMQKAAK